MGESVRKVPAVAWIAAGIVVALIAVGALLLVAGSSSSEEPADFTGTGYPNGDLANTRAVAGPIDTGTVDRLETAWTLPIEGQGAFGSYASSPILANGVVYSQDLGSNVQAIDLQTGEVLWKREYELASHGPNGVVVQDGLVLGATPSEAFALDQETGEELWSTRLIRNDKEGIDMAPGYHDGTVYVSTVPVTAGEFYGPGGVGVLWALNAKTGERLWHFDTVPKGLWGRPDVNSGGGLWYPPAFDDEGFMYAAIGNPAPFPGTDEHPWGSSRPGPNLYADSILKLNARTGKLQWHHQVTPHSVYDWDFQNSPILLDAGGRQLVLGAGKSGFAIAFDRNTGDLVWKRAVGKHNGRGNDGLYAMRGEYEKLKTPMTVYPGSLGGVIAPGSTDGETLFVPVVNSPLEIISQTERREPGPASGELVALDVASGEVKWSHEFATAPAFGFTTVTNDLVFATTSDGKVHGFDTKSGRLAWQADLPAGTNAGVAIQGDTLIAPAGLATAQGQTPQLVAYRLGE